MVKCGQERIFLCWCSFIFISGSALDWGLLSKFACNDEEFSIHLFFSLCLVCRNKMAAMNLCNKIT